MTTRPKFTKALLLRLCAVGLFLSLGTFAVMHSLQSKDTTADQQGTEETESDSNPEGVGDSANSSGATIVTTSFIEDTQAQATPATDPTGIQERTTTNPPNISNSGGSFKFDDKPMVPVPPRTAGTSETPEANPSTSLSNTGRALLSPFPETATGNSSSSSTDPGKITDQGPGLIPPLVNNNPSTLTDSPFPASPPTKPVNLQPINTVANNSDNQGTGPSEMTQPPSRPLVPANDLRSGPSNGSFESSTSSNFEPSTAGNPGGGPPVAPVSQFATGPQPSTAPTPNSGNRLDATSPQQEKPPTSFATGPAVVTPPNPRIQDFGTPPNTRQNESIPPTPVGQSLSQLPGSLPIANGNQGSMSPLNSNRTPTTLAAASVRNTPLTGPSSSKAQPVPGESTFEGVQIPALAVQKIAPREVQVNREATFELIVKNTGRSAADNVQVHDYVPEGTRFVSAVPGPTQNVDGRVSWDLGTMTPGQQVSIQMKILPERPGDIGSVAHVTFGAQASAKTVCTQPKLSIRHEAPESVLIGQNFVLNIFVENKGSGAADDVVLQEDVPEGLEFAGGQKELEYAIGKLQPGETRNIQLRLKAAKTGQVRNVLVAHGAGQLQADDVVNLRIVSPQLSLQADGPSRKFLNRPATHSFSVANPGTAPATNVQLVAQLPRGLKFASANNQGQYDPNNHLVVWRLSKLETQKTGTVEMTTIPVSTGSLDIQVQAIADLNQQQQTTRTLVVEQLSELFFDIDDSADAIEVGTGTTFRVRVVNQGQIPATNVNVQVDFADGIQPESVEGNIRNQIRGQAVVIEPIANLAPGQEVSFIIRANAVAAGEQRTVVSVKSDDRDIAISKEESTHVYSDR